MMNSDIFKELFTRIKLSERFQKVDKRSMIFTNVRSRDHLKQLRLSLYSYWISNFNDANGFGISVSSEIL